MELTLRVNGTAKTLDAWGIVEATLSLRNQVQDDLEFIIRDDAFITPPIKYGDTVDLLRDGILVFSGHCVVNPAFGNGKSEGHSYKIAGPWWTLEAVPFQQTRAKYDSAGVFSMSPSTHVTLFCGVNFEEHITIAQQLLEIGSCAVLAGAAVAVGASTLGFTAPFEEAKDISCAEAIRRCLRWAPDAAVWWDYSSSLPTLMITRRTEMPVFSLPLADGIQIREWDATPREDIQVLGVRFIFESISENSEGEKITQTTEQTAGNTMDPYRSITHTFSLAYNTTTKRQESVPLDLAAQYFFALNQLQWEGRVLLREATLSFSGSPGRVLNLTGGRSELSTMRALIQGATYNLVECTTELQFGFNAFLSPSDLLTLADGAKSKGTETTKGDEDKGGAASPSGYIPPAETPAEGDPADKASNYADLIGSYDDKPFGSSFTVEAKARGGMAELIGFSEFVNASTPPKKYLQAQASGYSQSHVHGARVPGFGPCSGPYERTIQCDIDAIGLYDVNTGVLTVTGTHVCDGAPRPITFYWTPACGVGDTYTRTTIQNYTIVECCPTPDNGPELYAGDNTKKIELSKEDTTENALARLKKTLLSFEEIPWSTASENTAIWGARQYSFMFPYREVKLRIRGAGYLSEWDYQFAVTYLRRRAESSVAFTKYRTDILTISTGTDGVFDEEFDVPNEEGWETMIQAVAYK